jgi:hypothetical protein
LSQQWGEGSSPFFRTIRLGLGFAAASLMAGRDIEGPFKNGALPSPTGWTPPSSHPFARTSLTDYTIW